MDHLGEKAHMALCDQAITGENHVLKKKKVIVHFM